MIERMVFRSHQCPRSPWPRPARTRASTPSTRRRTTPTQTGTTGAMCCSTVCNFVLLRYNKYATLYAAKQEKKSADVSAAAPQQQQQPQPQQQQPGADSKLPDPHAGVVTWAQFCHNKLLLDREFKVSIFSSARCGPRGMAEVL